MAPPPPEIDVDALARLAGLDLSEDERRELPGQLAGILEYVARIADLDLDDVPATRHGLPLAGAERDDEPAPGLDRETVLEAAPATDAGQFRVPPVLPTE